MTVNSLMNTRPVRAVTFDFWSTLYHDNERELFDRRCQIVIEMARINGVEPDFSELERAFEHSFLLFREEWLKNHRTLDSRELLLAIARQLQIIPDEESLGLAVSLMEEATLQKPPKPMEKALETLQALKEMVPDIRFAVISDTGFTPGRTLRKIMESDGLDGFFRHMTFSDELRASKPSSKAFGTTLEALSVSADETIHVGDIEMTDIRGALDAGMTAVLFTGGKMRVFASSDAHYIIPSLDLLMEIIARRNGLLKGDFAIY